MAKIDLNFALSQVLEIAFYKRDEITTDLMCCEISISSDPPGQVLFFHEEMPNWQELIDRVSELPDFDMKWYEKVVQPPFQEQRTIAYRTKDCYPVPASKRKLALLLRAAAVAAIDVIAAVTKATNDARRNKHDKRRMGKLA